MLSVLLRKRVNLPAILTRRLTTGEISGVDDDYSLSTVMTESEQVKEGKATIRLPSGAVFYNPAQVFNRDLSVACLRLVSKQHHESVCKRIRKNDPNATCKSFDQLSAGERQENGLKIAEALSATGLRSIRYAQEIPGKARRWSSLFHVDARFRNRYDLCQRYRCWGSGIHSTEYRLQSCRSSGTSESR